MNPLDEPMDRAPVSVSPGPTILKYSLIGIAGIFLQSILTFMLGKNGGVSTSQSIIVAVVTGGYSIILYVLIMIFAIKEQRDKYQNGFISLGKAMLVSYLPGLIMATVGLILSLVYIFFIFPNYLSDSLPDLEGIGDTSTLLGEKYTYMIVFSTLLYFFGGCVIGVVLSLIVSAVMKKDLPFNSIPVQNFRNNV